jgi:membrane-bound lytic murein transglycosylase D
VTRLRERPVPARADELMPLLRTAFTAEGVPPELAWLAEAESSLDPAARSPAGARGLFQLMPVTARALGLSTFLPDERADVEKSARAAARYLRTLQGKFGDWPLALAAYNAGEGRVQRLLASRHARTFAEVSAALPSETRMYVPKVCATIAVRAGVAPDKIPPPRA